MSIYTEINNGLPIPLICYLIIILIFRIFPKIFAKNILTPGPRLPLNGRRVKVVCLLAAHHDQTNKIACGPTETHIYLDIPNKANPHFVIVPRARNYNVSLKLSKT